MSPSPPNIEGSFTPEGETDGFSLPLQVCKCTLLLQGEQNLDQWRKRGMCCEHLSIPASVFPFIL